MVVVLGFVAWRIFADTAGQSLALADPEAALAFAPWEPTALDELAQRQLGRDDADVNSAADLARRALLARPLDARALSLLGGVAQHAGDPVRTEALMRLSAARSWRHSSPHLWLVAHEIGRGRFEEALVQADGLMRVNYRYQYIIFPILALLGTDPRGVAALEGALSANPPWRSSFLGDTVVNGENDPLMMQLYQSLLRSRPPLSVPELKSYLVRLIQLGGYEQAYQDWRAWRSQSETAAPAIYNGNFERPIDGLPFNWNFEGVSGAEIRIESVADRGSSKAMRVQFSGARAKLGRVGQLLLLSPGRYRLELAVKAVGLRTERGVGWQVSCAESNVVLAQTDAVMNSVPWRDLTVDFSVPATDCGAQWLTLIIPARVVSETEIEGEVWFRDFRVVPEAAQ